MASSLEGADKVLYGHPASFATYLRCRLRPKEHPLESDHLMPPPLGL